MRLNVRSNVASIVKERQTREVNLNCKGETN